MKKLALEELKYIKGGQNTTNSESHIISPNTTNNSWNGLFQNSMKTTTKIKK